MRKRCIVHIDIDAFFAAVEKLLNPSLEGKPVVVGGLPHERGVASTASYEAREYGVHSGMPLQKAYQLCPQAVFKRGNYQVYEAFSRKFFCLLSCYSPDVEKASLDEAYLDLTHCRTLYSSLSQTIRSINRRIQKELGLSVSVGAASNKLLAKLATAKAKPGGVVEVEPEKEEDFLNHLDIQCLPGIGPKAQVILRMLNVRKIRDLRELSRATLRSLFGLNGEELYFQVRGVDFRPVVATPVPRSISRETTFLKDLWDRSLLLAHLAYLCDRIALSLRRQGFFAHVVEVKVRFSDFRTEARRKTVLSPVQERGEIFSLAHELFLNLFTSSRLSLRLVGIKVSDLVKSKPLSLFEPYSKREQKLGWAVDRIRKKYGFGSLLTVREKMLERFYSLEKDRGFVLKTASLTK